MTHGLPPYIWVFVDFGVKVQHGWIQGDDVVFPDAVSLLIVQVQQEVLLCNPDIHGGAREPHGLFDDAVCEQRRKTQDEQSISTPPRFWFHKTLQMKDTFQHQTRRSDGGSCHCAAQV